MQAIIIFSVVFGSRHALTLKQKTIEIIIIRMKMTTMRSRRTIMIRGIAAT